MQLKKAVFSDIDKTLIPNGSLNLLVQYFYKHNLLPLGLILRVLYWYLLYKLNWIKDFSKVIEKSSQLLKPLLTTRTAEEINNIIDSWFNSDVKKLIYPDVEKRIRNLHELGYEIYFVTSTLEPIANKFQQYFGFGKVVATNISEINGYYSTTPKGNPCHGKEKAKRIMELQSNDKLNLAESYAFTDHISDLAMLKLVGYPVVVNPKPVLKMIASKNKWEIICPKLP